MEKTKETKNLKKDHNSVVNQEIKDKFVRREVLTCFSYEMQDVLNSGVINEEDIENLYCQVCPECGEQEEYITHIQDNEYICTSCDSTIDHLTDEPQEIFEWWIVTSYLYEKLREQGQPVLEWGNNYYWGRTTTGQAISLDGVISRICDDMEILEGQKYDWKVV